MTMVKGCGKFCFKKTSKGTLSNGINPRGKSYSQPFEWLRLDANGRE